MTEFESCEKCKHYAKGSEDYPCNNCTNNAIDHYEPMSNEDRMTIDEAIRILNIQRTFTFTKESNAKVEAIDMAIEALKFQKEYQAKVQKCIEEIEKTKSTTYDMMSICRNSALDRVIEIINEELEVKDND